MSVSKAEFASVVARLTAIEADVKVLKAQNEVLTAQIAELKAVNTTSVPVSSKKGGKAKKTLNATQVAAVALKKAWKQHCLDNYEYPLEYTEAEEKKLTKTGKKDPLFRDRNHNMFAKSMQEKNASDYETFTVKWRIDNAPAPVEEESATESVAAPSGDEKKSKASPKPKTSTKPKEKAPVSDKEASAAEEESAPAEEESVKPVPATSRKVIKGSKAVAK